jgi:hypothetical protein
LTIADRSVSIDFHESSGAVATAEGGRAMRDMLTRRVAFVGVAVSMVSCASDGGGKRDEVVATQRQAVQTFLGPVVRGSSTKVCQLIGNSPDLDYETRQETDNKTSSRFGIAHTDLGYPVAEGNRTWFFFGDVSAADAIGA